MHMHMCMSTCACPCVYCVQVSWKAKLKEAFPNPNDYAEFLGSFSSATGVHARRLACRAKLLMKEMRSERLSRLSASTLVNEAMSASTW